MKPITVTLEKSRETKGTYRFDSANADAPVTTLYVKKSAFEGAAIPKRIVLSVTEAEA